MINKNPHFILYFHKNHYKNHTYLFILFWSHYNTYFLFWSLILILLLGNNDYC